MSDIITSITSKPYWMIKIHNSTIVKKWKEELQQQGISEATLKLAIQLLKKSTLSMSKGDYEYDDEYDWHLELGASAEELWTGRKRSPYC
eukprot:gene13203-14492_t